MLLVLVFGLITALILTSVFKTVLAGLILSYVFFPVYRQVHKRLRMKTLSALLVTLLVLLLLIIPAVFLVIKLWPEVPAASVAINQYVKGISDIDPKVAAVITNAVGKAADYFFNRIPDILLASPAIAIHLFIVFLVMYYMLKDGESFVARIKKSLPLRKQRQDALIAQFDQVTYAVIFGTVVVAMLQGVLMSLGFFLFGVPSPVIWGIVTFIVSLVPFLGPFAVWLPASAFLMLNGYYSGDNFTLLRGVGLFMYGLLLVSGVDNILKPRIISRRANIHPALVFLGIIGGVKFFGLVGFIVGPVIIAMFKAALDTYIQEKSQAGETTN